MNRILVVSDTHNYYFELDELINKLKNDIDAVIHLGDNCSDVNIVKENYKNIIFYNVRGNCDYKNEGLEEQIVDIQENKIFLTHGSRFRVKYDYSKIVYAALEREVDICLFGHTHCPVIFKEENIYFMNPGSIVLPRSFKYKTYGIINFCKNKNFEMSVVSIEKEGSRVLLNT